MKKILFLCGHNAGRSQMAQAYFNHYNKDDRFTAISAGTNIASELNSQVVDALDEQHISMDAQYPKPVTNQMLTDAFRIYTMGCNVTCEMPEGIQIFEDWNLEDPAGKTKGKVKDIAKQVREKVLKLLEELSKLQ